MLVLLGEKISEAVPGITILVEIITDSVCLSVSPLMERNI